jgi:hypothetical protein
MSKILTNFEMAEILLQLLVQPDSVGELDESEKFCHFMESSAELIADFCGGDIGSVRLPDSPAPIEEGDTSHLYSVAVYTNDSLPSLTNCIWSPYDPNGWEDEEAAAGESSTELYSEQILTRMRHLTQATKKIEDLLKGLYRDALDSEALIKAMETGEGLIDAP